MSVRKTVLLPLLLLAGLVPAGAAEAKTITGPCVVGVASPRCEVTRGTVPRSGAEDGDTLLVHLDGSARGSYVKVRITGVQAMELHDYVNKTGECQATAATYRLNELLRRGRYRVRLSVEDPSSFSRKRPLRTVAIKVGRKYVDVGTDLIKAGLAVWLPNNVETHLNDRYAELTQRARKYQLGLFNPAGCGAGYQQGLPMQLWVNGDPAGADAYHLDQEYMTIRNNDPVQTLDLSGWWVRDAGLRRYTFAAGTTVAPGQTITVHVGRGSDSATDRWWGLKKPVMDNEGDGAFLFDPEGDIRASMVYPCQGAYCTDPLQGLVGVEAKPAGKERVTLTNNASFPLTLQGYRLRYRTLTYAFAADDTLAPGEQLQLDVQGYPDDDVHGRKSWGRVGATLRNGGGNVTLETFDGVPVGCSAWGTGACGG